MMRLTKRGERVAIVAFLSFMVTVMGFVGWLENLGMN
jgi:hypothetical protein